MPLTDEQRAELEALGPETVRAKLIQVGPGRGPSLADLQFSRRLLVRDEEAAGSNPATPTIT
jgi:hypothetical protein